MVGGEEEDDGVDDRRRCVLRTKTVVGGKDDSGYVNLTVTMMVEGGKRMVNDGG